MSRDDDLAATATAVDGLRTAETPELAPTLGRYTIERELGAGGMGIVYAAFDPELERRVALKVLRPGLSSEAEQRLLREARAMARLADPNVVAVYEVGTVDGRDYIAMELIDGETLVEWQARERPDHGAVLAAYVAAGHGLATAHEAGIVHRDFKPHNILRSRRGRVVVTDFGLAREAGTDVPAERKRDTPSPLSGLTIPGSLLGTPAYMAPEQWNHEDLTPATDQFAFCVGLWEGLAGERPFRGDTPDEIRASVLRGPVDLDDSKIPRRLRAVLRRGLAVDPAARWPSMTALLAQIARGPSRTVAAIAFGIAMIAIGAVVVVARSGPESSSLQSVLACDPPAVDPATVWGPAQDAAIRPKAPAVANYFAGAFARWQSTRASVCGQTAATRSRTLACLDKVLIRIDAIRRARLLDVNDDLWAVVAQIYEPAVCLRDDPPRMPEHYSDAAIVGLAMRGGGNPGPERIARARAEIDHDACARSYLNFVSPGPRSADDAKNAAQLCGDDQAYGAAALNAIRSHTSRFLDPGLPQAMREAERAVEHAAQPFLTRQFEYFRAEQAQRQGDIDQAIGFLDRAAGGEPRVFEIRRRLFRARLMLTRSGPDDPGAALAEATAMRAEFGADPGIDALAATARWWQGDVAHAYDALVMANQQALELTAPPSDGIAVHGIVVDAHGLPAPDAVVATGPDFDSDASGIAVPLYLGDPQEIRRTTTDASGHFTIAHVAPDAAVAAQRGSDRALRSRVGGELRLVLRPTMAMHGRVLDRPVRGQIYAAARIRGNTFDTAVAPVARDGTVELGGLPSGTLDVRVVVLEGSCESDGPVRPAVEPLVLEAPRVRDLAVVVRSATGMTIEGAMVSAVQGSVHPATVAALQAAVAVAPAASDNARAIVEAPPPELAKLIRPGDVLARLHHVPDGQISVCARGVRSDPSDPDFWGKYEATQDRQPVQCVVIDGTATSVVIEVPPMRRVD